MKKKILVMIMSFMTILYFTSCGKETISDDSNTLTLLIKKSDSEKVYIQRIMELYESESENKIKPIVIEDSDFDNKSTEVFNSDDIPDMFFHFNDSALESLNSETNFYYMNNESWVGELNNNVKASCLDSSGNLLGLPFWENSLSGCYYNKKLMDELGLRPASTQTEFDTLCEAIKTIGYTPIYWAGSECNWMFQFALDPIFADNPELLEKLNKNEITYADIPAVENMITWLNNAAKQGWFNSNYSEATWNDIAPAIENGEAVFVFIWDTWFDTDFKDGGKYTRDDFALMPVFMNTVDTGTYEGGNLNMLMVNKNGTKLDKALEFLNFCAEPKNYNKAFDGISTMACFKNQTTNIQSKMVTDVMVSVESNQRVSTAWSKIVGYKPDDIGNAVLQLFQGKTDVAGCIKIMDEHRIDIAKKIGAEEFDTVQ